MKTQLVLFGRHFNMAPRINRRRLVVAFYGIFAVLMVGLWFIDHWGRQSIWIIWIPECFVFYLIGGFGNIPGKLIKPFQLSSTFRLDQININDERELNRRDAAHTKAFRPLGLVIAFALFADYLKRENSPIFYSLPVVSKQLDEAVYGLLMLGFLLFISLPQAILLWTEPDMEPADEGSGEAQA